MSATKKMVEVWINQHSLKVGRATVVETRPNYQEGFNGMYHGTNGDAVVYTNSDDLYEGIKKALRLYKAHCRSMDKAFGS
jgi:hypothetical protein